jgi:hypothetical protein
MKGNPKGVQGLAGKRAWLEPRDASSREVNVDRKQVETVNSVCQLEFGTHISNR